MSSPYPKAVKRLLGKYQPLHPQIPESLNLSIPKFLMDKAAFIIYLVTLIISALLFGAVHTYAYSFMALGVLSATVLLVIKNIRKDPKKDGYRFQFPNTSLNVLFLSFLAFLIFQMIPLPDFLSGFLSPEAKAVGKKSFAASVAALHDGQGKDWFALSPYDYPVRMSIIRFTVYGFFFLGLIQVLNSQKRLELMVFLILIIGCFEALYGLFQAYSGSNHIWWFKKFAYQNDVTGTYINRNHFAGFMEMGLLLAAAYTAGLSVRKKDRKAGVDYKPGLRGRLSRYLSGEPRFNKRTLILFAGVVMGIGLIFSASRGGMISGAGGMLVMGLLLALRKNHRNKGVILLILFALISVYALRIGVEYPVERFKSFYETFESRSRYAKKTMDMFEDYRLTGVGMGNFQYGYSKYQAPEDEKVFIRHAHNDWAQFLAEAGIMGLCALVVGISYYLYRTIRLWKRRSDPFAVCLGVAPIAAMAALAIHSYSDFNLHIPANFLMLVAIMAIGYSALHLERRRGADKTRYHSYIMPLKYKGLSVLIVVFVLVAWSGVWTVRHFVAEAYCNTVTNSTLNRDQNPSLEEIQKAISWDPWNAEYQYKLAREMVQVRSSEIVTSNQQPATSNQQRVPSIQYQKEIVTALEKAVRLNPFRVEYHARLAWEYAYLWQDADDPKRWLSAADLSMERAAYFVGEKNPGLHVSIGNYWVVRSKTMFPSEPAWEAVWAKANWHYKKALDLEKREDLRDEIEKFVRRFYPVEGMAPRLIFGNGDSL